VTGAPQPTPADLAQLRGQFPGWPFGAVWASAATGPDNRRLWAAKGGILISAWNAAALAADIRRGRRALNAPTTTRPPGSTATSATR
jgi:hypothetical protein